MGMISAAWAQFAWWETEVEIPRKRDEQVFWAIDPDITFASSPGFEFDNRYLLVWRAKQHINQVAELARSESVERTLEGDHPVIIE